MIRNRLDLTKTTLAAALLLLSTPGCEPGVHADGVASARPMVTVAQPVTATVHEYSEHTGRAEAPQSVEIRARVSGQIVRAAFREGDLVKKGTLLFVVDPRPFEVAVARAKAEQANIGADHELARKNLARSEQLIKSGAIPQRDLDVQRARELQLAASEEGAAAALASARLDLEYAHIRSPIDGRVGRKLVTEGNLVGPTTTAPMATVVSIDPLYVYVDVDEARGLKLTRGKDVAALVGFAGDAGYPREARVDFIDNHVDSATGTMKIRAVVPNHDGLLAPGLFARVRVPLGATENALLVADSAIATDQDRRFVWLVDANDKVQYRGVKLGPLEDGLRVVREGLVPSDRVLISGLQRARAGVDVTAETGSMRAAEPRVVTR